jgi:hypothetical protein
MDEDTGNIAFDSIGDSDGTIIGDPQRPGKIGNALIFDGIDDRIDVTDFSHWNTNITIEAWIYWDQSDPSQVSWYYDTIAILGDPVAWNGYVLYVYTYSDYPVNSGRLAFCSGYDDLNNTYSEVLSTDPLSQGEWHHIVATADGTTMSVYIDGVPNNSIPQLYPPVLNPGLIIGDDTWGRHFDGTIDEMAIYNRVLTAEEIQGHYENGLIQGHYENGLIGIGYPCVEIDIKPGSYPNSMNLGSHGVIPVAILTTDFFDATTVDPGSVMLEGLGVALRGKSDKLLASEEDVDGDGDNDLIVKINTENLEPGIWQDGPVLLTGSTYDGQDIVGTDDIIVVPPEE